MNTQRSRLTQSRGHRDDAMGMTYDSASYLSSVGMRLQVVTGSQAEPCCLLANRGGLVQVTHRG